MGRQRRELRALLRERAEGRAMPRGRRGPRNPVRAPRADCLRLARLRARDRAPAALWLSRARSLRAAARPPLQPEQSSARSVRQGHRRPRELGQGPLRLRAGEPRRGPQDDGQRRARRSARRRRRPCVRLGRRRPTGDAVSQVDHLRGARPRRHDRPPRGAGGAPRQVRRPRQRPDDPAPSGSRRDGRRAPPRSRLRRRQVPARSEATKLLGIQQHIVLLSRDALPTSRLRRQRRPGVQVDGQAAAFGRHRGHPGRGLQPYRGGQSPRPDAQLQRHRQPDVLPTQRRAAPLLFRLHRDRQQPQRAAPADAAAHHGFAPVLGPRDARRRLPLRPGVDARAIAPRGGSALELLHDHPPGPRAQPGQAHRGALGRRGGRISGGKLPDPMGGVEREIPRFDPVLLEGARRRHGRARVPAHRQQRPLSERRPRSVLEHQLRHRP